MPAPSFRVKMNITTSEYGQYMQTYHSQQRRLAAAAPPLKQSLGRISLNSPMVGRIYNVRPGCGSCGK